MLRNASKVAVRKAVRKAVTELARYPKPGDKLHGFTLVRAKHVPELELTALHLQHDKTGADYLHVAREDKNNVFSIGFKTNPPDDTGVPHILEHTTLCGSEKYPIRDPFFKMLPRTLSNFMNAFTASDHTFYPFSTTNKQDFKNLMSVYLDATLHPLLKQSDFTQEGWRIGPENPQAVQSADGVESEESKLVFKGVVYNEMKGQMSDAGYLYYIRFQDHIFPAINNSGGDPQKITDLTYEQLKKFHAEHYHPSNAKVFTYGDMPLADHLVEVNAQLNAFERIQGDFEIRRPIDLSGGPQNVTVVGPVDPMVDKDMQYKTSTSWLMGDATNILEQFSLGVMSALLMDGYGSPLYRNLIEAGLGTDWSPNSGFDSSGRIGIFSVGLTGVKEADIPKVKEAIQKTFKEAHATGFEKSKIDGYLHQLEISLKHKTANFGMGLMQRIKPQWFEGVDPFESLAWNDTVSAFETELAKGGYLEGLMEKYLLNDNTLTFTMTPSTTYGEELAAEEAARLAGKIAEVTAKAGSEAKARAQLEKREAELLVEQGKSNTEDLSCLPTVYVKDIPRQKETVEVRDSNVGNLSVQWREAPTNGLTYFRAVNMFENIPIELRSLIPLFTDCIMRLGTKNKTMEQLEDLIKLKTGGISASYFTTPSPLDFTSSSEGMSFAGTVLDRNVPDMFNLLTDLVLYTDFDSGEAQSRIRQLLQSAADGAVNNIASSGHVYARRFAEAGLTYSLRTKEEVSGLSQIKLVTSLASRPESEGLADVIEKLKAIQKLAFSRSGTFRAAITCGSESVSANEAALEQFSWSLQWPNVPDLKPLRPDWSRNKKTFFPLPYQVYYGALALPTESYVSPASAPLQILSQLLTHKHLHHEIREKGGAYGGGAYSRGLDGVFGFYSYRDPNPQNTMSIMRNAGRWAVDKQWSDRDLEEAKLSVFQSVDAPQAVSDEGMARFLSGVSDEMLQERRERLLDVTKKQVREVAQKYLIDLPEQGEGRMAFLGEKKQWVDGTWETRDMGISSQEPELVGEEDVRTAALGS
ncbi:Mitochondrial presequence protease [Cadophora gregata]|uniref:Mitochondrial presequence protease n=1 Tax=Cadophora gregata TaxID=51156 RepID=UPI0026DD151B|nr:Mitochondrial presequence protease [Cadophora gregata]KAK0109599.1 Mitochondrial presequence protease [Cadophora gregata]